MTTTDEMRRLYVDEGESCERIGARFGLSKQAVHQRLTRAHVPMRTSVEAQHDAYDRWASDPARQAFVDLMAEHPTDVGEIARETHVPETWVRRLLVDRLGEIPRPARTKFTDDQLLLALRDVFEVVHDRKRGRASKTSALPRIRYPMSRAEYDGALWDERLPRSATIVARFGRWSTACERAGVPSRSPCRQY